MPESLEDLNRELKDRTIRKQFGKQGWFEGVIKEVWREAPSGSVYAHVEYTDGDKEDLSIRTARALVVDGMGNRSSLPGKAEGARSKSEKRRRTVEGSDGQKPHKKVKSESEHRSGRSSPASLDEDAAAAAPAAEDRDAASSAAAAAARIEVVISDDDEEQSGGGDSKAMMKRAKKMGKRVIRKRSSSSEDDSEKSDDAYREGFQKLIRDGLLQAGEKKVCVTSGSNMLWADLLADGHVSEGGKKYCAAENWAATVFPESQGQVEILVDGRSIEELEDMMAPPVSGLPSAEPSMEGNGGDEITGVSGAGDQGRMDVASSSGSDSSTALRWLQDLEGATAFLESHKTSKHNASVRRLKALMTKIETALKGADASLALEAANVEEGTATKKEASALDRTFGMEVLELHWIPVLHAYIEQKLEEPLPSETFELGDLQRELMKIAGVPVGDTSSLSEMETPVTAQLAQLADMRYQLSHSLYKARIILGQKQLKEQQTLEAAKKRYDELRRILESVKAHELGLTQDRRDERESLEKRIKTAEAEERRLQEELEMRRTELTESKNKLQELDGKVTNVKLVQRKTQRWKEKVEQSCKAHKVLVQRLEVLKDFHEYLDSLQLDDSLTSEIQIYLSRVSSWCSHRVTDGQLTDVEQLVRCRIRLSYEVFSLVRRIWGGEINVKVKDIRKLQEAFQAAFVYPERGLDGWELMPVTLPRTLPRDSSGITSREVGNVVRRATAKLSETVEEGTLYVENEGQPEAVSEDGLRTELNFKTCVLLARADGDDVMAEALAGISERLEAEAPPFPGEPALRDVRFLVSPDTFDLHVPPLMSECLILVHAQEYLLRLAQLSTPASARVLSGSDTAMDVVHPVTDKAEHESKPVWWERADDGTMLASSVRPETITQALRSAALVCKAVDLLLTATPLPQRGVRDQAPDGSGSRRYTNALCCLSAPSHLAGRYGNMGRSFAASKGASASLINSAVLAVMYARVVWSVRKVAVIDISLSFGRGTYEILRGDDDTLFASVHAAPDGGPPTGEAGGGHATSAKTRQGDHHPLRRWPDDCCRAGRVLVTLRRCDDSSGARTSFERAIKDKFISTLNQFRPEMIMLSTGLGAGTYNTTAAELGITHEEYSNAVCMIAEAAERLCSGRLLTLTERPYVDTPVAELQAFVETHLKALRILQSPNKVGSSSPGAATGAALHKPACSSQPLAP